jgi:hypothetical protein
VPFTRGINILAAVSASIGHVLPKPNRHRALADVVMAINNKRAIRIFTFVTSARGPSKIFDVVSADVAVVAHRLGNLHGWH